MQKLATSYMGIAMNSPVMVGSCSLSKKIDNIKAAEDAGAGALVIKSLFEEQLQMEAMQLEDELEKYQDMIVESLTFHPPMEHGGPSEHLMWVEKARKAVSMPLIASLNAVSPGTWSDFAVQLERTGVDGLELNLYSVVTDPQVSGQDVLQAMIATLSDVKSKVKIPVAVKLSPYFASPAYVISALESAGADAVVLFNRFSQPNIDINAETLNHEMVYSAPEELLHTLRWIGLLHGGVQLDLCANTGIHTAQDAVKLLLAGADSLQVVSALMIHGIEYIRTLNRGILDWMDAKGYQSIDDFRGNVAGLRARDPYAFERSQYIKLLLGFD